MAPSADMSDMAALVGRHDWAATLLGARTHWPQSLQTTVDILLAQGFPAALLWGRERIQIYNDAYRSLLGDQHPAALGNSLRGIKSGLCARDEARLRRAWAGHTVTLRNTTWSPARPGQPETARYDLSLSPVRDETGTVAGIMGLLHATSARLPEDRRQERSAVLVAELRHRMLNLLGLVRSMADSAILGSTDLQQFQLRFHDRIDALARVQGWLSRLEAGERVDFEDLLHSELSLAGAWSDLQDRVELQGPRALALRGPTVQALALALHELTTNALKHGAFRQATGHLAVAWRVARSDGRHASPWLQVEWHETGITTARPEGGAPGSGQGRVLIEKVLPYQYQARVRYVIDPHEVRCCLALPLCGPAGR